MINLILKIVRITFILLSIVKDSNSEIPTKTSANYSHPGYSLKTQTVFVDQNQQCTITHNNINDKPINIYDYQWQSSSILNALIKVAINRTDLVAEDCLKDFKLIQENVLKKTPWAIKVLDSSAPQPTGFIYQQNYWFGSYGGCRAANEPFGVGLYGAIKRTMKPGLIDEIAPFRVDYRVIYLRHNSPWQIQLTYMTKPILHLGLCLPVSCTSNDIYRVSNAMVRHKAFMEADLYEFRGEVLYVKDLKLKTDFFERRSWKLMIVLLITTIALIIYANHIKKNRNEKSFHENEFAELEENNSFDGNVGSVEKCIQDGNYGVGSEEQIEKEGKEKGRRHAKSLSYLEAFVKCFDLCENWRTLFGIKHYTPNEIPAVNGIRVVLAFCVLQVHVGWFARHTINNASLIQNNLEKSTLVLQNIGLYLVDGFLTISGFLQTYILMKDKKLMDKVRKNSIMENVKVILVILAHRYLRLAPLYFVTMCTADLLAAYLHDVSLFHIYERDDLNCPRNWWRNIFFIQNYYPYHEMCAQWTWTLSCEMQYFVFATFATFIYVKHPKFIKYGVVILIILNLVYTLHKGVINKYQLASEGVHLTMDEIYVNPWVRVTPFIVGCVTGCYLKKSQTHQQAFKISLLVEKILWNITLIFFFGTSFTMDWRDLDYIKSIILYTLGRIMMSLSVAWIMFGSASGRSCWWSKLLEAKIFQHFNRLAYAIYLVNPLVISLFASLAESSAHGDLSRTISMCAGATIIIYAVAALFSLLFEIPYSNWSKRILKHHKEKVP